MGLPEKGSTFVTFQDSATKWGYMSQLGMFLLQTTTLEYLIKVVSWCSPICPCCNMDALSEVSWIKSLVASWLVVWGAWGKVGET